MPDGLWNSRDGGRVVLVLSDGLGDDVARAQMGFLEHLVESRVASRFSSRAALPTVSRPNYETLHTGARPYEHGITGNGVVRASRLPNLFSLAAAQGLCTAAVAYSWISELYTRSPFDPETDLEQERSAGPIHHGRFYTSERQPDEGVIEVGMLLSRRYRPHYLLVHPMGADHAGHAFGADSAEYRNAVLAQDHLLATAIPRWLEDGYAVLVTGDHGAGADRTHGGTSDLVRHVPLYAALPAQSGLGDTRALVDHTQIAPTIATLLGVPRPSTMGAPAIVLVPLDEDTTAPPGWRPLAPATSPVRGEIEPPQPRPRFTMRRSDALPRRTHRTSHRRTPT